MGSKPLLNVRRQRSFSLLFVTGNETYDTVKLEVAAQVSSGSAPEGIVLRQ